MSAQAVVAAFDFDKTLTTRDNVVPFLRRVLGLRGMVLAVARHAHRLAPAVLRRDRDRLRTIATAAAFAGRAVAEIDEIACRLAEEIVAEHWRADTIARLRWHIDQGHTVVIVSASYEEYLRPVAEQLGDVGVVGTRLDAVDGRYTGALSGPNCRAAEKVERLRSWLADRDLDRSTIELFAYGDSSGDRELLAWADHPQWVNEPLASVAPER